MWIFYTASADFYTNNNLKIGVEFEKKSTILPIRYLENEDIWYNSFYYEIKVTGKIYTEGSSFVTNSFIPIKKVYIRDWDIFKHAALYMVLLEKNPYHILFIEDPSEFLCNMLIKETPSIINYIRDPTKEQIDYAIAHRQFCYDTSKLTKKQLLQMSYQTFTRVDVLLDDCDLSYDEMKEFSSMSNLTLNKVLYFDLLEYQIDRMSVVHVKDFLFIQDKYKNMPYDLYCKMIVKLLHGPGDDHISLNKFPYDMQSSIPKSIELQCELSYETKFQRNIIGDTIPYYYLEWYCKYKNTVDAQLGSKINFDNIPYELLELFAPLKDSLLYINRTVDRHIELLAISKSAYNIQYIKDINDLIIQYIVEKDIREPWFALKYAKIMNGHQLLHILKKTDIKTVNKFIDSSVDIKNRFTRDQFIELVEVQGCYIQYVRNPSPELLLKASKTATIEYFTYEQQTKEICENAFMQNVFLDRKYRYVTEKMLKHDACGVLDASNKVEIEDLDDLDGVGISNYLKRKINNMTDDEKISLIKKNPLIITHIDNPTEYMKELAVRYEPYVIGCLIDPSEHLINIAYTLDNTICTEFPVSVEIYNSIYMSLIFPVDLSLPYKINDDLYKKPATQFKILKD